MNKKTYILLTALLLLFVISSMAVFAGEPGHTTALFKELDHVMIGVSGLDTANQTYSRLGFTVTPPSDIFQLGIGNRVIFFSQPRPGVNNFFELMAKLNPDRLDPYMSGILSGPDGIKMMVHITDEAERSAAAMGNLGYIVSPVWSLWVERKKGDFENSTRFRVYAPRRDQLPLPVNGWNPVKAASNNQSTSQFSKHANGAVGFDMITGIIANAGFDKAVAAYETIYGVAAKRTKDKVAYIQLNHMTFRIMSKSAFLAAYSRKMRAGFQPPPSYVSLRILVEDMAKTEDYLTANGFTTFKNNGSLVVPPAQAGGVLLEFVPARAEDQAANPGA